MLEILKKISFYFLIFFFARLILIFFFPTEHETKYDIVALNILSGCGVSFSLPGSKECIPAFGPNGPGYPFFLASLKFFFDNDLFIKIVQIFFYFSSVLFIKKNIYELTGSYKLSNIIFLVLSISPLAIAWTRFLLPETMMISFTLFFFGYVIRSIARQKFLLFELSLILVLMTFFRVDSIFFIIPIIYLIFKLNGPKIGFKKFVAFLIIFSLPWSIWSLRNLQKGANLFPNISEAYETISKNKFPIGYNKWVFSWADQQYNFASALNPTHLDPINKNNNFNYENIIINDEIYFNEKEKIRTKKLINKLKLNSGKPITSEIDKEFESLAKSRIEENRLYYYSILPLKRSINMWLNPYYSHGWPIELSDTLSKEKININNKNFIQKISLIKKFPLEIALKGTFFLWSITLIILFILIFFKKKNNSVNTCYKICLQLIFLKTIFFAYTGFFETRYIVNLIPLIEILIILVFNQALRKSK